MRRTYKIIVLLLSIATCSAKAKTGVDELCKIIDRDKNAYITINRSSSMVYDLDFEACQNNQKVKDYFLKLLDVHEYLDYHMTYFNQNQTGILDEYLKDHFNRTYVDSVYRTPALLKHYSDMLRNREEAKWVENFYEYTSVYYINHIFSHLRYPEAYQKILANVNEKKDSEKFRKLLRIMQDHEEWKQFLAEMQSKIRDKSYSMEDLEYFMKEYNKLWIYGSSSVDFFLCMLDYKDTTYYSGCSCLRAGGKKFPFNIAVLGDSNKITDYLMRSDNPTIREICYSLWRDRRSSSGTYLDDLLCKMNYEELEKISEKIIQNKEAFVEVLEPLKKKLDEENNWWRSKIPYRKGE
ncbi:MAG: hypothetical protein IKP81_13160 [Paludibacteraceae bacterium]|nr:hypothetical protein [Paludibacteraceae bacterium]